MTNSIPVKNDSDENFGDVFKRNFFLAKVVIYTCFGVHMFTYL
ncbi:hypothetical protein [Pseudochryseolinea flava]|nr:hypothetical protein [Pseudochryseolinea flava]